MQLHADGESWREEPSADRILIVLGESLPNVPNINGFIRSGGGVLIACDGSRSVRVLRTQFQFRSGMTDAASTNDGYDGMRDCPIVTKMESRHPTTKDVSRIVTNRPATLDPGMGTINFNVICEFPPLTRYSESSVPFALATKVNSDRPRDDLLRSLRFSNQMITLGDNATFAVNTLT